MQYSYSTISLLLATFFHPMLVTVHVDAIVALICESEFCEMFYKLKAGLGKIYLHSIRFATYTVIHN